MSEIGDLRSFLRSMYAAETITTAVADLLIQPMFLEVQRTALSFLATRFTVAFKVVWNQAGWGLSIIFLGCQTGGIRVGDVKQRAGDTRLSESGRDPGSTPAVAVRGQSAKRQAG